MWSFQRHPGGVEHLERQSSLSSSLRIYTEEEDSKAPVGGTGKISNKQHSTDVLCEKLPSFYIGNSGNKESECDKDARGVTHGKDDNCRGRGQH